MCPERQILSVYFDGELNSPWKEKLEKHLETCSPCRDHLASYRLTRHKFAETSQSEQSLEQSMNRVWEKIGFMEKPRRRFWASSITIPIPIAAAAGLAMVVAMAALLALRQPIKINEPQLAGLEMQEIIPVSDMASFFQYLGNDNSSDMVIIRLPDTTFKNAGEPQILRAADYRGGGSQ
ncbi:MAG: zf-HC2 domain-containing protein [Treponema sp.]|nr:zf-HC2 domain-containing protein [Treponema sp.]